MNELIVRTAEQDEKHLRDFGQIVATECFKQFKAFEMDYPASYIRGILKASAPSTWKRLLEETGAVPTRTVGCTDMYRLSDFLPNPLTPAA